MSMMSKLKAMAYHDPHIPSHKYPITLVKVIEEGWDDKYDQYYYSIEANCRCADGRIRRFCYAKAIDERASMLHDVPPLIFWDERLYIHDYYSDFHSVLNDPFRWRAGDCVTWDYEKWVIHRFVSAYKVEIELADWPVPVREIIPVKSLRKWGGA